MLFKGGDNAARILRATRADVIHPLGRLVDQNQMYFLTLKLVVIIQALSIDQRDIAFAVFRDNLFGARLHLVCRFGKIGALGIAAQYLLR